MMDFIERLFNRIQCEYTKAVKKRICKFPNCGTILSQCNPHKYCFVHYRLLLGQKMVRNRIVVFKVLNCKHKTHISLGMTNWWKAKKENHENNSI